MNKMLRDGGPFGEAEKLPGTGGWLFASFGCIIRP
jgi:hypothetical protein